MKITKNYIKRRYFELRTGNTTVSPILQITNFIMLSYLTINELIPIWLFAPIFIVTILIIYTLVGNRFRKVQITTDINMNFEKSTEANKSVYIMMKRIDEIAKAHGLEDDPMFTKRMQYVKDIGDNKL